MLKKIIGMIMLWVLLILTINFSALADNNQYKAVIRNMNNKVEIKYGESLWRLASINQLIRPGTSLRTGPLSKVELLYPDGTITRIGSRTSLVILDKDFRAVKIESGKIWFKVTKKSVGLKIYSPTALAAITGTEGFAEFGKIEPDEETNNKSIKIDSNDKNVSSNKVAETSSNNGFNFGLTEGSAEIYHVDKNNGEPLGEPIIIEAGQILDNSFNLIDVGTNFIEEQNNDVSQPDETANNDVDTSDINEPNENENDHDIDNKLDIDLDSPIDDDNDIDNNFNLSPTTGELEIVIE